MMRTPTLDTVVPSFIHLEEIHINGMWHGQQIYNNIATRQEVLSTLVYKSIPFTRIIWSYHEKTNGAHSHERHYQLKHKYKTQTT